MRCNPNATPAALVFFLTAIGEVGDGECDFEREVVKGP